MNRWKWSIAQSFEKKWWKRYTRKMAKEKYLSWKTSYWLQFLKKTGIHIEEVNGNVLDIGCGPAGIYTVLNDVSSANITAIDPLLDMYDQELSIFSYDTYPNVHFISKPIETAAIGDSFRFIFCLNAINHVQDIRVSISNMHALLEARGTLIVSVDVHRWSLFQSIFRWIPLDILHPHQYTLSQYIDLFIHEGFTLKDYLLIKKKGIFGYYAFILER